MILIHLERHNKIPIYQQVTNQLKKLIENGTLTEGFKLPSSRVLADQLKVNRTTITRAYEELWATGYLESRSGSYSYVRQRSPLTDEKTREFKSIINWPEAAHDKCNWLFHHYSQKTSQHAPPKNIDFRALAPDPRLMPIQEFRKSLNRVIQDQGSELLGYGDPSGYAPLRLFIAQQMGLHGMTVHPEDILITSGAQEAISLVTQLLAKPGKRIAVEAPTYSSAIPLFQLSSCQLIPIPVTAEGMNLEVLEQNLKAGNMALVYTIPNFQNPTGITTSQTHRENLLKLCEKYQVPLVEDGFEEEMKYLGKQVMPIKSMDAKGVVIYLGTFSKILFPGLRVGWIAAPQACIQLLKPLKHVRHISDDHLKQAALEHFCRHGQFEMHIKRMHRIYRKRMQTTLKILREHLANDTIHFTKPMGGFTIWFTLEQTGWREEQLIEHLARHGVQVSPGSNFYPNAHQATCFRVSIAQRDEEEIEAGLTKLCQALNQL